MAHILIVDNEAFTVRILSKILEKEGHTISTATSGKECLELISRKKPDLLLLDIMMPEVSGWDVVKTIRDDPEIKDLTIAMISAKPKELDHELAHLADYQIAKPIERKKLVAAINKILS